MASISAAHCGTSACFQAFAQVQRSLSTTSADFSTQISSSALQDEVGRLRVWAANIGALQKGHASLDYRLREASLVRENVLKLLKELYSTLQEVNLVLSGTRLPYDMEHRPVPDDNHSDSSSSFGNTSEESSDSGDSTHPLSELCQRFLAIVDIIDNLYKLSRSIRTPVLHARPLKAASYKKIDKDTGVDVILEFKAVDLAYVTEVFLQFRRDNKDLSIEDRSLGKKDYALTKRLANAITQRRQQFMYWKRHRDKLGIQAKVEDFDVQTIASLQQPTMVRGDPIQPKPKVIPAPDTVDTAVKYDVISTASRTALTATTATLFLTVDTASDNGQSTTSFATTARGLDGSKIELPSLPKIVKPNKDFECPYCFTICPAKYQTPRNWRTHLLRDLRPYICTYLECPQSDQLFGSRHEWLEHERANHRKSWQCPEHATEHFSILETFKLHLQESDHNVLTKLSMPEVLAISETSDPDPRTSCPICLVALASAEELQKHVANHLERFAAFALPKDIATSGDDDNSSTESRETSGAARVSGGVHSRSNKSDNIEPFYEYTREDLITEINSTLEVVRSVIPAIDSLFHFENKYFPGEAIFDDMREKMKRLQEIAASSTPLGPSLELDIMAIQQTRNILERLRESSDKNYNAAEWYELHEQLRYQQRNLSALLLAKQTEAVAEVVAEDTARNLQTVIEEMPVMAGQAKVSLWERALDREVLDEDKNAVPPINPTARYRAATDEEEGSQPSLSNLPTVVDYEESDFFIGNNNSQSSIGVPTFQDMAVTEESRTSPINRLPADVLANVFSKLSSPVDLLNCMCVSKRWARNSVDLLWNRPACTTWLKHSAICRTISLQDPYFAYRDFIKRLNLAALADRVNDGSVLPLSVCTRVERLTLTNCKGLTDHGLIGLVTDNSHLSALDISGDLQITDGAIYVLAEHCRKLQGLNISRCIRISNEAMIKVAQNCRYIKRLKLIDCHQLEDPAILAFAQNCPNIIEIDLHHCSLIGNEPVTALISLGQSLRELRLAECELVSDAAFTSLPQGVTYEHIHILDLASCSRLTDRAVERIIDVAPRLRNLVLAKCGNITDVAVNAISKLGRNLHYIHLGHCNHITDEAVIKLVQCCNRIRYLDLSSCVKLTDASVTKLATLPKLRRISLVKCNMITDNSVYALSQSHTGSLERVHLSYCTNLTLRSITVLLNSRPRLTHLSLTGVHAFLRSDLEAFCRDSPQEFTQHQREVFKVFSGQGVTGLRRYLNQNAGVRNGAEFDGDEVTLTGDDGKNTITGVMSAAALNGREEENEADEELEDAEDSQ